MKRTTVMVDEATYLELERWARRDGVPTARLVREAMDRYVTDREAKEAAGPPPPLPSFVGMFSWDGPPYAADTRQYLEEHWPAYLDDERSDEATPGEPDR